MFPLAKNVLFLIPASWFTAKGVENIGTVLLGVMVGVGVSPGVEELVGVGVFVGLGVNKGISPWACKLKSVNSLAESVPPGMPCKIILNSESCLNTSVNTVNV